MTLLELYEEFHPEVTFNLEESLQNFNDHLEAFREILNFGNIEYNDPFVERTPSRETTPHPVEITPQSKDIYDRNWLLNQCRVHMVDSGTLLEPEQLCTDVFSILRKPTSEDIQSSLVDLLGYTNLDFIGKLVEHRGAIVENIMRDAPIEKEVAQEKQKVHRPIYGAQVTVQTEAEKQANKLARKEMKKQKKLTSSETENATSASILGFSGERLREMRAQQLSENASAPRISNNRPKVETPVYPNVYQSGDGNSHLSMFGTQYVLPVGTERMDEKDFEEVRIPVSTPAPVRTTEKRISIDMFEQWIQPTFKGYTGLNRVQSIVYPIAFQTNENMLVCAPTGAGKTDVAMLTVLRAISQNRQNGVINLDDFKIIYVAPMKALAAEVVRKFSGRLAHMGIKVRELTGDMQMTKAEIVETQMIVTTPEKWDVVTRKSVGDTELVQKVKLLIIDEVHLLHEDRGAVIESIVARTLRLVESSQSMIRIVGLSATLPNYVDVASFLGVNLYQGLFYFDSGFRPIPLEQNFIGIKSKSGSPIYKSKLNELTYSKVSDLVRDGHQVMVFVHSRKDTVQSAKALLEEARNYGEESLFSGETHEQYGISLKDIQKSRNRELKELFPFGLGIHHAGMLRSDRTMTERMFEKGILRVLFCTATLAWGVNLPAYAVVIKGTQLYNAEKGAFVDLSILDVLQIFGRAGRPQFEDRGVGFIITSHDRLNHYVSSMTRQHPIESSFGKNLENNLNAEISLGTITNIEEAIRWLSYTYYFVRMRKNPFQYGIDWKELEQDPTLVGRRRDMIATTARKLHKAQMIVFDDRTGYLTSKDLGRIASNFYINYDTIEGINSVMRPQMTEADVFAMLSKSTEFGNINVRQEELVELKKLEQDCECKVKGGTDTNYGKTNILLQAYISKSRIDDFALISDCGYVAQNSSRILRALFEIALSRNWGPVASVIHSLCLSVEKRLWSFQNPLTQFDLPAEILYKVDQIPNTISVEEMRDMSEIELGELIRHARMGALLKKCVNQFPLLHLSAAIAPITKTVLRVTLEITPDFQWFDRMHGNMEPFFIWVEESENAEILYTETFLLQKRQLKETQKLGFTIPIPKSNNTVDGLPSQIFIRALSDRWLGAETILPVSFKHLILPDQHRATHTDLLPLDPLPISALHDSLLEAICEQRFQFFNPVQTQVFHTLYNSRHNVLLGAPTGSGKTVAAELALWSAFRDFPNSKVVYIAPLKALVRERVEDWGKRLAPAMGKRLVELTGDTTPDIITIEKSDIIITTPEKWDGVSRSWKKRKYVSQVSCVIIDEIHLLGGDRGPILEVIVSRMNYISAFTSNKIRIVGLSTALANAADLADWLGIGNIGLFNFRHSVRPVPLEIYIEGYPGKHYCPRMISMNKPTYAAIVTHSPTQPVIVFVSSRRQTRLTAQDLISLCSNDENPKRFLNMHEEEMEYICTQIKDQALRITLPFGIGLHHAGIVDKDRRIVEELFCNGKIQVLIATSTLAWGVNFPAHLVVVKGTEFYDAKLKGYKDFPITDVLQMMGRAGRPQFDDSGVAVILVHDVKKDFYKKFLHEPFPVESSLHECLHEHLNAEISSGTIKSKQDAMDYMTWTYLYRRVSMNPTFYGCEDGTEEKVGLYLSQLIERTLYELNDSYCVSVEEDTVKATPFGAIASYYYLRHNTIKTLKQRLARGYVSAGNPELGEYEHGHFSKLLRILCDAAEYDELPLRHNEDLVNKDLEPQLPIPVREKRDTPFDDANQPPYKYDDPHVKAFLLLQAHLSRFTHFSCADYITDTISVLDQAVRITQAMIDVAKYNGYYRLMVGLINMLQCIKQAIWPTENMFGIETRLVEFKNKDKQELAKMLGSVKNSKEILKIIPKLPFIDVELKVIDGKQKHGRWYLESGKEYTVVVTINNGRIGETIYSKFPKPQTQSYFVILSDRDDVVGFSRVSSTQSRIKFKCPLNFGEHDFGVDVMNDGYYGLDVFTNLRLVVV
ncbi:activating signal cointegrator 1 complex subunit [Boothiomyces sp. JEL0866]|nr:activating signal cointegrator 1 complex subunit [Boothiomyces sp. JEL0866]